jgi:arylsulfatase A-like enzyme/Flp pilus assembly protein TadD
MKIGRFWALLAASALVTACGKREQTNVLLVTFDTTRADHLGYASGRRDLTPNLDRLAREGTWFSDCSATAPVTLVSHASILTGLYPPGHGVRDNGRVLPDDTPIALPLLLHGAGLETHAVVSAFVLASQFGLGRGFDSYDDDLSSGAAAGRQTYVEVPAARTADRALDWLGNRRAPAKPFFLWIHFFDPHGPYTAPEEIARRFPGDPYSAEIAYADRELGRVLDDLERTGELRRTLVVFTADHGESLGEHEEKTHGVFLYQSTIHVPLFFSGPGVPRGEKRAEPASGVDILPTVAGLFRLPDGGRRDGVDLFRRPRTELARRDLYFETMLPRLSFGWEGLRAERNGDLVAIEAPRSELYDLGTDPEERHNLWSPDSLPSRARPLFHRLERIRSADLSGSLDRPSSKLADEAQKNLASLGYLSFTRPDSGAPRPDPKDRIKAFNMVDDAIAKLTSGKYAEAAAAFQGSLHDDPGNLYTLGRLAFTWECLHDRERALAVQREIVKLDPDNEPAALSIAELLGELGRTDEARRAIEKHEAARPASAAAMITHGRLDLAEKRLSDAERAFRQAMAADPKKLEAVTGLAETLRQEGKSAEAADLLRREHLRSPQNASISYNLAVMLEAKNDVSASIELYKAAVSADPLYSRAWNNLGILLEREGRRDEALRYFEKACEVDSENAVAAVNLGARLLTANQAARALSLFERAVRLEPGNSKAAAFRARSLQALGRRREALEAWSPLLEKVPVAWIETARLSHELGDDARAQAALKLGIRRDGAIARQTIAEDAELSSILSSR